MGITYRSPWRMPERILAMGIGGAGKSNAILQVARKCPDATFFVVDTDYSASYDRALDMEYTDLSNVEVHRQMLDDGDDFDSFVKLIPALSEKARVGEDGRCHDWLVVDSMTPTWGAASAWYTDKMFGQDVDEYFFAKRQARGGKVEPGKGDGPDIDWDLINKTYFKRVYNAILEFPGHVYLTAELDVVKDGGARGDDRETRITFGPFGVKPRGQKKLGHVPSTVLYFQHMTPTSWELSTPKDRNREVLVDHAWEDFTRDYLVKIAGWKPTPWSDEEAA